MFDIKTINCCGTNLLSIVWCILFPDKSDKYWYRKKYWNSGTMKKYSKSIFAVSPTTTFRLSVFVFRAGKWRQHQSVAPVSNTNVLIALFASDKCRYRKKYWNSGIDEKVLEINIRGIAHRYFSTFGFRFSCWKMASILKAGASVKHKRSNSIVCKWQVSVSKKVSKQRYRWKSTRYRIEIDIRGIAHH